MKITTFRITRKMGHSEDWSKLKLVTSHIRALNEIGTLGSLKGEKLSIQDYFDRHLSNKRSLNFKIETIKEDKLQKTDELLIIQVTS